MQTGNFDRKMGQTIAKYTDSLPGVVQKRLNQTRCHLGHELRWVQGSMHYIGCTLAPPCEYK